MAKEASVTERSNEALLWETLAAIAPGTELRDALERILRGRTGAIIVLGFDDSVEAISSGGFHLAVEIVAERSARTVLALLDAAGVAKRRQSRSKYGAKRPK